MERKNNISAEELKKQQEYIAKIRSINEKFEETEGRKKTMCIQTFGCQMNAHDSEKILGMLEEMGYVEAKDEKSADFIIYNTCCVRENAENKVYGNLGFLKHQKELNPHMKIALCGCMMQQSTVIETIRQKYKHVDIVFGTFNLYKLPELMYRNIETNSTIFDIWDKHGEIIEDLPSIRKYKFKASVNIMFGCNNFCSYCIVPYVRGRERSRTSEDIVREIKSLVADGVKEITLLGQNVNSYGKNLEEDITFAQLLRKVNEIEGLERIRFMTSHPKDLSDELIIAMKECDKVCNHIHLPFQAGNNEILKSMNRRYTKEHYLELVEKIRKERNPKKIIEYFQAANIEFEHKIVAEDVLSPDIKPATPDNTLEEIAKRLILEETSGLPVVDKNGKFLGEITERELIDYGMPEYLSLMGDLNFLTVGEPFEEYLVNESKVTIKNLYRISNDIIIDRKTPIMEICFIMVNKGITRLYVVDDGKYYGMIKRSDIIKKVLHI